MKRLIVIASLLIALTSIAISQEVKKQCKGITTKGVQCMNRQVGEYCHYHNPAKPKCGDPDSEGKRQLTSNGQPCKNPVKKAGEKCWRHQ